MSQKTTGILNVPKSGDIQNTSLTPDKELNILIYCTPFYVIIYTSHTL